MGMICALYKVSGEEIERLQTGKISVPSFMNKVMGDESAMSYLDKAWQMIHFGLSGEEWECHDLYGCAIMGGDELGGEDSGVRLLGADLVAEIAGLLVPIDVVAFENLMRSRDLEDAELYAFDEESLDEDVAYAVHHYETMRQAYLDAAGNGCGMVISIG